MRSLWAKFDPRAILLPYLCQGLIKYFPKPSSKKAPSPKKNSLKDVELVINFVCTSFILPFFKCVACVVTATLLKIHFIEVKKKKSITRSN